MLVFYINNKILVLHNICMDITRYHGTRDTEQSMHYHPTLTISMVFHYALTQNHVQCL